MFRNIQFHTHVQRELQLTNYTTPTNTIKRIAINVETAASSFTHSFQTAATTAVLQTTALQLKLQFQSIDNGETMVSKQAIEDTGVAVQQGGILL